MITIIVQTVSRIMIPFIQLFGLYVIMHGHISPGGGFQGGAIFAASLILLTLTFGLAEAEKRAPFRMLIAIAVSGALVFTGIGMLGILFGGYFLDFLVIPLPIPPADVSELMIVSIEIAIGVAVMALLIIIFFGMAEEVFE